MHHRLYALTFLMIQPRTCVCISLLLINLACCNAIHEHFHHIPQGHFHPNQKRAFTAGHGIINPIFKMVLISALMMQPRGGIALLLLLCIIGAAIALKIFRTDQKFCQAVLAQIMRQPLPVKPNSEAALPYQPSMVCNCLKMFFYVHSSHSFLKTYSKKKPQFSGIEASNHYFVSFEIALKWGVPAPCVISYNAPSQVVTNAPSCTALWIAYSLLYTILEPTQSATINTR